MNEYSNEDIKAMKEAIKMSAYSLDEKNSLLGGPFGAAIYKDGKLIAKGCNHVLANNDPSAHAEVYTIREACKNLKTWNLEGCVLYTSCEPCPMCLMTAKWANISKIYFAATRKDAADIDFKDDELYNLLKDGSYGIQITECHSDAVKIMQDWFKKFKNCGMY